MFAFFCFPGSIDAKLQVPGEGEAEKALEIVKK